MLGYHRTDVLLPLKFDLHSKGKSIPLSLLLPASPYHLHYISTAIQPLGGGGRAAGMLLGAEVLPVGSWQAQLTREVGHGSKPVPWGNKPFSVLSGERPTVFPQPVRDKKPS